jgi:hypothetical protein
MTMRSPPIYVYKMPEHSPDMTFQTQVQGGRQTPTATMTTTTCCQVRLPISRSTPASASSYAWIKPGQHNTVKRVAKGMSSCTLSPRHSQSREVPAGDDIYASLATPLPRHRHLAHHCTQLEGRMGCRTAEGSEAVRLAENSDNRGSDASNSGRSNALRRNGDDDGNDVSYDRGRGTRQSARDTSSSGPRGTTESDTELCSCTLSPAHHRAPGAANENEALRFPFLDGLTDEGDSSNSCSKRRYVSEDRVKIPAAACFTSLDPGPLVHVDEDGDPNEVEFDDDALQPGCRTHHSGSPASPFTPLPRRRSYVKSTFRHTAAVKIWRPYVAKSWAETVTESLKSRLDEFLNFWACRAPNFVYACRVRFKLRFKHRCSVPFAFNCIHNCSLGPGGTEPLLSVLETCSTVG